MATITELRHKRAALWEKTKKFLDDAKRENDMLSADDVAAYEKMEAEIVALGKEIGILERQAELEKKLNAPVDIEGLVRELGWAENPARLRGFLHKYVHCDFVDWLTSRQAAKAIEGLKSLLEKQSAETK